MTSRFRIECDGGSRGNPGPAGIGALVIDDDTGEILATVSEAIGVATNNVAEYRSLIGGLEAAADLGLDVDAVLVQADSQLLVRQITGEYRVKQAHLKPLVAEARALLEPYAEVELRHVPREQNTDADALVNAALDAAGA